MQRADLPYTLVTGDAQLAACAAEWRTADVLALDTEFVREKTFHAIPGLVQVGTDAGCWLLDPMTIGEWGPLAGLFADSRLPKVLHAGGEDLELLVRLAGVLPAPLYDTQVGAALAGLGFSLSYQALVEAVLGVAVEKDHTRSDWTRRPLAEAQCRYAALDVAWLPPVYRALETQLAERGRVEWWREEGDRLLALASRPVDPDAAYLKVGGGWRLAGPQLVALQALCAWREREAVRLDQPRGWLLKDQECLEIARRLPRDLAELRQVPDLLPQHQRQHGDTVLALVAAARARPAADWPMPLPAPLAREQGDQLRRLRRQVERRAAELGLAPEVLARKRDCERLLRERILPAELTGWRAEVIGHELVAMLEESDV